MTKELDNFVTYLIRKVKRDVDSLFDFSIDDKDFKESYGYTKERIKFLIEKL